jgi:hypothetical protein
MRADADFMVYVAARWPSLVKEAVLLGVRPEEAAEATTDALSRCRRDWGRASREEDVDALVHAELLLASRRRPRTRDDGRDLQASELLVLAPPTLEELRHQESVNNRATLRRAALIAVPLLLVGVGVGVYLGTTGGDRKPATPDVGVLENAAISQEENPAPGIVWYADGQLHLDHTVLAVEGLQDMTRIGTGVVYGDDQGRVVYAADDGSREVLGHKDPEVPVAATDETGWAAWVETGGDQAKLVIKEATTGNDVASAVVDADAQVVAVDGGTVYYVDAAGAHQLLPGGSPAVLPVTQRDLLDVRSRIRAFQLDEDTIEVVQSVFNAEFELPGQGAELSPDGNLVATVLPGNHDAIAVYDTRSGEALPNGVPDGDHVVTFAPGARLTVTYVVAPAAQSPGRELELRTCELSLIAECAVAARIPNQGDTPVLAR